MRRAIALMLVLAACQHGAATGARDAAVGSGGVRAGGGAGGRGTGGTGGGGMGGSVDAGRDGGAARSVIDSNGLRGKMLFGYQGWFAARGDGSPVNSYHHWLSTEGGALRFFVDMWPDLSELEPDELLAVPGLSFPDGRAASVYSAFKEKTVVRHFAWMREHDLDGVFLQRFLGEVQDPRFFTFRNQVTRNVRAGAEAHGRVFAIEYDLSLPQAMQPMIVEALKRDWMYLVDTLKVTESARYLREGGKPVLAIWGFGFMDRPTTPAQAQEIITWFKTGAPPQYQAVVIGGVPAGWRTLTGASQTDPAWATVYRSFDVVSPWSVGGFVDDAGADRYAMVVAADLAETKAAGIGYLPVMFPGFSWHNLKVNAVTNQIPRRGGRLFWRQTVNLVKAGATSIKTAMFDEVDEGTAMFKLARTKAEAPAQAPFVTLDADGEALSNDFYLRLSRAAGELLRGERAASTEVPIGRDQ
ncbi:MAG TPA: glycoside hydrolase family 71/99-like protein [Polyangia bacterium]